MFTNLKNKLLEEVKASPSKIQQLASAAQAAVSSTSSTASNSETVSGSDNFFSITEEDTPQNSPMKSVNTKGKVITQNASSQLLPSGAYSNNGAIPRTRKLSNSSMASDISFRLPSYDSPAVYHLQSDLDASASEIEDSSSSTRLDLISKEQLHDAYRKALDRYQKYRGRYTDLAKRYKDLERDSAKSRAVLVETQDKAIRRIGELREQCTLEQQAKAHLEEALRMEMDDMQCKLKTYQTKLKLLDENGETITTQLLSDSLIQLDSSENNLINLDGDSNHLNSSASERISQMQKLLNERNDDIENLSKKLKDSDRIIDSLRKREEENSILLAQNKLAIHGELDKKENEVKKLTNKVSDMENLLQKSDIEKEQLQKKVEELSEVKEKLKLVNIAKQELDAKVISSDHMLNEMKKGLKEKEKQFEEFKKLSDEKLSNISSDYEKKLSALRIQNDELQELTNQYNKSEIVLAEVDNELNHTKTENDSLKERILNQQKELKELQVKIQEANLTIQNSNNELSKENEKEIEYKKQIEDHKTMLNNMTIEIDQLKHSKDSYETQIKQLMADLKILNDRHSKSDLNEEIESKTREILDLKTEIENVQKNMNLISTQLKSEQAENSILKETVTKYENSCTLLKKEKDENQEKMESEKDELQSQIAKILNEIQQMDDQMQIVKKSHDELEKERQQLENKVENLNKINQANQEGSEKWNELVNAAETKLKLVEQKLQSVESENFQLAEKNCLLEENSNRLEKLVAESEINFKKENGTLNDLVKQAEIDTNKLREKVETLNENNKKMNEKMAQVLDENSRLHNAKEIMEHEFRSLEDKCETIEKVKLCVIDSNKCLEDEIRLVKEENENLTRENTNLGKMSNDMRTDLDVLNEKKQSEKDKREKLQIEFKSLQKIKENLDTEVKRLNEQIGEMTHENELVKKLQDNNAELQQTIVANEKVIENLKLEIQEFNKQITVDLQKYEKSHQEKIAVTESEMNALKEKLSTLSKQAEMDLLKYKEEKNQINEEVKMLKEKLQVQQSKVDLLTSDKDKYDMELLAKTKELELVQSEFEKFKDIFENNRTELQLKIDHSSQKVVDNENQVSQLMESLDAAQAEKLEYEQKIAELENSHKIETNNLQDELRNSQNSIVDLTKEIKEVTKMLASLESVGQDNELLLEKIKALEIELAERTVAVKTETALEMAKNNQQDSENLRKINEHLQRELEDLKYKSSVEISNLTQEIEDLTANSKHIAEKLADYERLRQERDRIVTELQKLNQQNVNGDDCAISNEEFNCIRTEKENLENQLKKIMHEVQDVSNRNLFLEQKCENYLILEQSNERLKLANDKLSRQLDETLVSLQHNEGISANTEFEYLKNIMFQYLTAPSNGNNNDTLIKVISAVLKFSPQQTQVAIEKEHQRRSVLGQLNKLL